MFLSVRIFIISFIIFINCSDTHACTSYRSLPIAFDSTDVMFLGTVKNYVGPLESSKIKNPLYGIIVELNDSIFFPNGNGRYEVFPLGTSSDCRPISYDLEKLNLYYPIGSQLRIIGKHFSEIDKDLEIDEFGKFRIFSWSFLGCYSVRVNYEHPFFKEQEVFNFKNFDKLKRNFLDDISDKPYSTASLMSWAFDKLKTWNLLKSLLRLESTTTDEDRFEIISRIMYCAYEEKRFKQLVEHHIESPNIQSELMNMYKKSRFN